MVKEKIITVIVIAGLLSDCATARAPDTLPIEPQFANANARKKVHRFIVLPSRTYALDVTSHQVVHPPQGAHTPFLCRSRQLTASTA